MDWVSRVGDINLPHTPFPPAQSPPNKKFVSYKFLSSFSRFSFRNAKLIVVYVIEHQLEMYILREYYSDLALNKICFWHFITMSQSTKRRWNSGPSTPSSTSKKKKYNCKFQDEWKKSHHWLQSSSLGNDLAFCTLCSSNFSVASGGLYDIKRHSETSLHKKAVTATNKTPQYEVRSEQ